MSFLLPHLLAAYRDFFAVIASSLGVIRTRSATSRGATDRYQFLIFLFRWITQSAPASDNSLMIFYVLFISPFASSREFHVKHPRDSVRALPAWMLWEGRFHRDESRISSHTG